MQSRNAVIALLAAILSAALATMAAAEHALIGQVLDPDGRPVAKARILIYTASVREGTSPYCPSCYPDCRKTATSDREGRFSIRALSDSLRFRVLVVAKGWEPAFTERVDPIAGPVELHVAKRRAEPDDPERSLHGRVLDPMGQPVVGATLAPFGFYQSTGGDHHRMSFGSLIHADPLAVTDDQGRFWLALRDTAVEWYIRVRARDLAPLLLSRQPASAAAITVRMRTGATVSGRLLANGRPLPGVTVGLLQAERAAQYSSYGHEEIATDERGVFTFVNVTAGQDYLVHGKMASLKEFGVLDTTRVHAPDDDGVAEVGDVSLGPGRRVAGQVVLSDGGTLPPNTRLLLGLDNAFDAQTQPLDESGRFEFRGVPPGDAELVAIVKGYRVASESSGYDAINRVARCSVPRDHDVHGLRLVLEPGTP